MNKWILLFSWMFLFSNEVYAAESFRMGFQAGASIADASVTASPAMNASNRTGFALGGNFEAKFTEIFSVQPELYYVQKGATVSTTSIALTVKRDYIEVPVLLKATYDAGFLKPFVFSGPVFDFKANSSAETSNNNRNYSTPLDNTNSFDFGWTLGAGTDFQIDQRLSFFINARYSFNFIDAASDPNTDWKSRGLLLFAGFQFGI